MYKRQVYIGAGAIIKQGRPGEPLIIGKDAVIGMGTVVRKNVEDGALVFSDRARSVSRKRVGE